jgi:hypothetical protein
LQVEGDVGDVEKEQRRMIEELRDKLSKSEATTVAKSERALKEAEKFSQKAAHMQAELSQYKSMVGKLEQEKAFAEEDARSKQGELQRLERQLLQELHDLKVRGIQTVQAAAPGPAVDEGQVRDLRRELDRYRVECDRLRNEVDQLRRAPPAPAPAPVPAAAAGPCQNCEQTEGQVRDLQQQLQRARGEMERVQEQLRVAQAAAASGGGGAGAGAGSGGGASAQVLAAKDQEIAALKAEVARLKAELENDDLKGMISAFASGTQAELEKEVMELRTQNAMLEAQVEVLEEELAKR